MHSPWTLVTEGFVKCGRLKMRTRYRIPLRAAHKIEDHGSSSDDSHRDWPINMLD
jgi:hypothetical protein